MPASLRIGLIGFGEVGSSFARGFLADGLTGLVAYDEPRSDAQRDLARRRSVELGVPLLDDPAGLADRDLVVCCVPQDQAMAAAERCAGAIAPDALYVDVNSLGPPDKIAVAERVAALGRTFVDAAIMGMPINDLHRVPVLASGEAAQRFAELGGRAGMRIRVAGARPATRPASRSCAAW
ncbi:NAD(P)-binding domain-containing protein [Azospirillum agricola]|uniref:NAD(P)-binding domain-containing protein n=1 Tax=Azospirillum agricola TaxID=1720247 RepID=UPI0015C475BA|nr:NAD(P)-binding domain-containing protein [Azospirillum agricola]